MFTPIQSATALFMPPTVNRFLLAWAPAWEELGERWLQTFAGVIMIEASKQVYGAVPVNAERKCRRVYMPIPGLFANPCSAKRSLAHRRYSQASAADLKGACGRAG